MRPFDHPARGYGWTICDSMIRIFLVKIRLTRSNYCKCQWVENCGRLFIGTVDPFSHTFSPSSSSDFHFHSGPLSICLQPRYSIILYSHCRLHRKPLPFAMCHTCESQKNVIRQFREEGERRFANDSNKIQTLRCQSNTFCAITK